MNSPESDSDYDELELSLEKIKKILLKHGIRMSVESCGCCNSPWVAFEYKGEMLLQSEAADFNMFKLGRI